MLYQSFVFFCIDISHHRLKYPDFKLVFYKNTNTSLVNIYIFSIIQTTRNLKLIKPISMHLDYSASQIIKMDILAGVSAIFLAFPPSIFWHAFPTLLSPFQWPSRLAALQLQEEKTFRYYNECRMLRSFVRTLPFKFHQLNLTGSRKLWRPCL